MKKTRKSLGATSSKLLTNLSSKDKVIFAIEDALTITKTSMLTTRQLLTDLVRKKWLIRLMPGKYLIVPLSAGEEAEHSENWYVIAKNLIEPKEYYLSHYSALDIHEMLINPPITVYISSPIRRISKEILGATFRFVYIQPKDVWGIEDVWVTPSQKVKVSDLERTVIDCLDRPDLCGGISEIAKGLWAKRNDIDYKKLVEYAKKFDRKSVVKRLGFLLGTYGLSSVDTSSQLKKLLLSSYASLDPTLPASGHYNSAWKLRLNLNPDELIEMTKT